MAYIVKAKFELQSAETAAWNSLLRYK
jgi:hypothetical protein